MANDIAWAAVDFLTSIKEVVEKDFPDESVPGSDVYLKAIVRPYLGRPGTAKPFRNDSNVKPPDDDSKHIIELMVFVRYLDKEVKHLEKTHDKATGNHGVKAFPGHDDTQEALLRGYLDLEELFPKGGCLVSSPQNISPTSSMSTTSSECSFAHTNVVTVQSNQCFTFDIDRVIVPFDSKEGNMGKDWLHLQCLTAKDEQTLNTFVNPSDLPA